MSDYFLKMKEFLASDAEVVLVRVIQTEGSAPRDPGTMMLVNKTRSFGTIGGGYLEYEAIKNARQLTGSIKFVKHSQEYTLGPVFGQCCGGTVKLSYEKLSCDRKEQLLNDAERYNRSLDRVLIFGAGHVGQALFRQIKFVPFDVSIIDSRPASTLDFLLPDECKITPFPEAEIRNAGSGTAYVILTHDHALDFLLVKEALSRDDAAYIGMIGSKTKKAALKNWLQREGVLNFENVFTPLGRSLTKTKVFDKRPDVIASFIIVEILISLEMYKNSNDDQRARNLVVL